MIRIDIGLTSDNDRATFSRERLAVVVDLLSFVNSRGVELLGRWLSRRVQASEDTAFLELTVSDACEQYIAGFLAHFLQDLYSRFRRLILHHEPFDA